METPNTLSTLNLETGISFQALLPSAQSFHRSSGSLISPEHRQRIPMTAIGSLVIVGSGLRSICQFTMEAVMHIEAADKVYYCVIDAATKGFIEGKNSNSVNLYEYYSNDKPRFETYIQMAEVMLRSVRAGQKVVGVFYGHPGVFVAPSHRAIAIARDEGYSAQMLPGISAEDCLFADLLIDPSNPGTQTVEATDMLARERPLQTSSHVIIYQVGCIGNLGFNYSGINNDMFNILVDRLAADYGPDHPVVDYLAPMSPLSDASIRRYIISDLLKVEVKNTITAASTFYLPPKKLLQLTPVVETFLKCGDTRKFSAIKEKQMFPPNPFNPSLAQFTPPYGPAEIKAIKDLDIHTTPPQFIPYSASLAMQKAVESIYLNLDILRMFRKSPSAFAASIEGLEPHETEALSSGDAERINVAMQGNISPVAVASTIVVACVFMLFV